MVGTVIVVAAVLDGTNTLPTAFIGSPNFYATFLTTDSIDFRGSGNDAEDGNLIGASLVWTSDINGPIGTGESFAALLSSGSHTIILTVTDSNGALGEAIRIVNVTTPTGGGGDEGGGGGVGSPLPTAVSTAVPTLVPTAAPTTAPTPEPTVRPTAVPTTEPTVLPTAVPTTVPTPEPTLVPTAVPTTMPRPESTNTPNGGAGGRVEGTGMTVEPVPTAAATPAPAPTPVPSILSGTPVPASPTTPGNGGDGAALPAGALAGIVAAAVAAMSALIYYDVRRRRGRLIQ